MKKLATTALLAIGLAASASAAVTTGFEAGYLTDNKDAYWAGRVGWEFLTGSSLSHQVEFEYGYTRHSETDTAPAPLLGPITTTGKTTLKVATINYRAETTPADKMGYYFGVGLGQTRAGLSLGGSGVSSISDSDSAFTVQGFAGLNYKATSNATLHVGVKYLWIGDVTFFNAIKAKVGDDLALTAGVTVRF